MRYAGEYQDSESGFYYLRARYYDPSTQQFLTRDPLVAATGQAYTYANGSPTNYTDPRGLFVDTLLDAAFLTMDAVDIACNGFNWENTLSLGADLLGLALPFVTGLGLGVHAAAHADDVVKAGMKVEDTVRELVHACSFSADTEVSTPDGLRPISDIQVGDRVLAYDEQTGTTGYYTVTAVLVHRDPAVLTLTIDGEPIATTPEHPFYTADGRWVPAGDLAVGSRVRKADGSYGVVEAIALTQQPEVMYNLTVAGAHTFFVGAARVLVHNSCPRGGTYVLLDPDTHQVMRSGRTNDLARRQKEHARNPRFKDLEFDVDARTDNYSEQRVREHYLHTTYNPPLNGVGAMDARKVKNYTGVPNIGGKY